MTRRGLFLAILFFAIYEILVWLIAILWFADAGGPLFSGILTGCGLTVFAVYLIVARLLGKPHETAPAPAAPRETVAAPPGEHDEIAELIAEANSRLANSPKFANERMHGTVTDLPLYLMMGAEASGKTSAFLASGLSPELLAGQAVRETSVIPTRLSNFWFAAGALVVELSGRMLSREDGSWTHLLRELKPRQLRSPFRRLFSLRDHAEKLQGVFLFCDLKDFLGAPEASGGNARVAWARDRLRKIGEIYNLDFPVYVVFTRADALPYFDQYFARLREVEDQQILGCTLEAAAAAEHARVLQAFNTVYHSLAEKRMTFLEREAERGVRPMIYEFPRELRRVRPAVVQFLADVFRPNPLRPGPMLRGFYFTGTRQVAAVRETEGTQRFSEATRVFNRDDLRRAAGVAATGTLSPPRESLSNRWTFVSQLFHEVLTNDRGMTGPVYTGRRLQFYRRALYAGLAGVFLLGAILFGVSWARNRALVNDSERAMLACLPLPAENRGTPGLDQLRRLDELRAQVAELTEYHQNGAPWGMRLGLYAGDRVLPTVRRHYFDRFREYMLDRAVHDTEARLGALRISDDPQLPYDAVYNDLKSYRTVTVSPRETACRVDPGLRPWLAAAVARDRQFDAEQQQLIRNNIDFYVQELGAHRLPFTLPEGKDPVVTGRRYLEQFGGEQRIYRAIIDQTNAAIGHPVRVTDYAPNYKLVLSGPQEVPAAFSAQGSKTVLDRIKNARSMTLGESCVLGSAGAGPKMLLEAAELEPHLRNLYFQDYLRTWRAFLAGQKFAGYHNAADAAKKLEALQDNASPLVGLMFMIHENTAFPASREEPAKKVAAAVSPTLMDRLSYRFGRAGRAARIAHDASKDIKLPASQQPTVNSADVALAFQPAHELFTSDATRERWTGEKNRAYLGALTQMQRAMDALGRSSNAATDVNLNNQADQAALGGIDRVKGISETFLRRPELVYEDVARLLEAPFTGARPLIVTDFAKAEGNKLNGALARFCGQLRPVLQKYPFNAASENDATVQDVSAIFAPENGALWTFYQQGLAPLIVKQGQRYVVKQDAQTQTKILPAFLDMFNRLALVTSALFPDGGTTPHMRYRLAPLPNASLKSIRLSIDGETMTTDAHQFNWPGSTGRPELRLYVRTGDVDVPFASYTGIWGIFAMMTDADVRASGTPVVGLTSLIHGRRGRAEPVLDADGKAITVRIEIREFPGGVDASFDRDFFTRLRCPGRVTEP